MSAEELHWPDEHVTDQWIIDAMPEMAVPFRIHVFVFDTVEHLQTACEDLQANAHSITYRDVDADGIGALVMLARPHLELSIIAHEAAHISLFHHAHTITERVDARRWLTEHPESVAEMTGNIAALIWHTLPASED